METQRNISDLLGLDGAWEVLDGFSKDEVQLVIGRVCEAVEISEREFWQFVEEDVRLKKLATKTGADASAPWGKVEKDPTQKAYPTHSLLMRRRWL